MKKKVNLILISFIAVSFVSLVYAENKEDTIAYKLALMHTRNLKPLDSFLGKKIVPSDADFSEFKWIIDSLKHRCINPENAIADTIIETWLTLKKNGYNLSILETARELSKTTRNSLIFGSQKVNFRMTSQFWLASKLKKVDIKTLIEKNLKNQK